MSMELFKSVSLLPVLPRVEINADTNSWPSFVQAGTIRQHYLEVPLRDFKNCSTISVRMVYTGAAVTQAGHKISPIIFDKIGTKKIQNCSRSALTLAAGDKVNVEFVFTNSTSYFSATPYATDADTQDIQNNVAGYYTTAETTNASSIVPSIVQNLLPFSDDAVMMILYSQVVPFVNEPLNPLNIVISGNNI